MAGVVRRAAPRPVSAPRGQGESRRPGFLLGEQVNAPWEGARIKRCCAETLTKSLVSKSDVTKISRYQNLTWSQSCVLKSHVPIVPLDQAGFQS